MRPLLLISLLLSTSAIFAQQDTVSRHLDEVVITATRSPKLLKDVPVQTRVITADDIVRTDATDIRELLSSELAGVEFSYAKNQQMHMNFGGFAGQGVLFLLDGERLAGETMDDVDFSRINMENVERIEILHGASSALYGSNAVGGVINIITKKRTQPWELRLDGRLARHSSQRYGGVFGFRQGKWSNMLDVVCTSMDNYNVKNGPAPKAPVVTTIYGDRTWNLRDQMVFSPRKNLHLTGRAGYFFRQLERTHDKPERYRDFSGGLKAEYAMTDAANLEVAYAFDQYDKSDFLRQTHSDVRRYSNVQNSVRMVYNHTFPKGHVLTMGADFIHDYLMNTNLQGIKHNEDHADVFAQYDHMFSTSLELVGALRYDYNQHDGSRITPKLNLCYRPLEGMNIRLGYGMGFRAPALKERYYDFDMAGIWILLGNPDLKAETSHNLNFSADYAYKTYNFTLMAYYNSVQDRLAAGAPFYGTGADARQLYVRYVNLDRCSLYGGEMTAQARWHNGLSAHLSYALTKETLPTDGNGHKIPNQYMPARPHSLSGHVDYEHRFSRSYAIKTSLSGRWLSSVDNIEYKDYYDVDKGTIDVNYPAYSIWKFSVSQSFGRFLTLSMAVDNLFNYRPDYHYLNAPLTDGADFQIGIRINFF